MQRGGTVSAIDAAEAARCNRAPPLARGVAIVRLCRGRGVWIGLSDQVAALLFPDPAALTPVSTLKGVGFVAVTGGLLAAAASL
jgi:hypothetical protein